MLFVKKILLCLFPFFLSLSLPAFSQEKANAGLLNEILIAKDDTNKVNKLLEVSFSFETTNTDTSLYYLNICKSLIDKLGCTEKLFKCYRGYISIYNIRCEFQKGLYYANKMLDLAIKLKDKKATALGYRALAINYQGLNQSQTALKYTLLAFAYLDSANDNTPDMRYENISWIYNDLKEYDKAIFYGEKGIENARITNFKRGLAKCLNNTGIAYASKSNYKKAAWCFTEQLRIAAADNNKNEYILALIGLCNIYFATNDKAALHHSYGLLAAEKNMINSINDLSMLEAFYYVTALVNIADGQLQEAEKNVQTGFDYCKKDPYLGEFIRLCRLYSRIKFTQNDFAKSEYYKSQADSTENRLVSLQILENTQDLETKYASKKKESELLKKDIQAQQQWWIISALALGILAISVIGIIQYSNYKNKRKIAEQKTIIEKQNALSEERLRIAADMHDDVGAGLSRIRYISSSLQSIDGGSNDENIKKIVSLSDESVEKMNEIIWALNQGNQQLEELIYYTRSQCSEMVSNAGMAFTFDLPENIPAITLGWKECRNIYLLVKEAVNNAIKHSGAGSIIIECTVGKELEFSIADNGKGFDADMVKKNGNGLLNYKKRIDNLKGTYQLITSVGEGTTLLFKIPLNTSI